MCLRKQGHYRVHGGIETWESPQTGLVFPVKFLMDTSIGRLWGNVKGFYGQELQLHIGSMYDVPLEFHKNGPEGKVIGEGFGEATSLVAFAENSPPYESCKPARPRLYAAWLVNTKSDRYANFLGKNAGEVCCSLCRCL